METKKVVIKGNKIKEIYELSVEIDYLGLCMTVRGIHNDELDKYYNLLSLLSLKLTKWFGKPIEIQKIIEVSKVDFHRDFIFRINDIEEKCIDIKNGVLRCFAQKLLNNSTMYNEIKILR